MEIANAPQTQAVLSRAEILSRLRERIVAFAASRLSGDSAEDLAQEVMLVLHEKYSHLSRIEDLLPLSFQILRFKMLALRRKAARRGEAGQTSADQASLPDPAPSPECEAARRELLERLMAALEKTGERCRELFRLKLEGRSYQEIQELLGVRSLNTIYTWDHRCRRHLLELMGGRWE